MNEQQLKTDITTLKNYWQTRNTRFKDWYEMLILFDTLAARGLESYTSNEPQTFYDMAHFLLTRGDLSHSIPIEGESTLEYDRRAKIDRACRYMWGKIDRGKQLGGSMSFKDEIGFFLLVLGWYSTVYMYEKETGLLHANVWNPYNVYPRYANGQLITCLHSYKIEGEEAVIKAQNNGWDYNPRSSLGSVNLDDYWQLVNGIYHNIILIDGRPVTDTIPRPEMKLAVGAVAGFPDKGSLSTGKIDWRKVMGRSIFETNKEVYLAFNKAKTMASQIIRDTVQPITQEFSSTPQASPEEIRERGALFHYGQGEGGLVRLPPAAMPIELQAHLMEMRREIQKGGFNDAVWGMLEGQSGYALDRMADASANQILYPYMDAKHLIYEEGDRFWLSNLKTSKRVFDIRGEMAEKLKPTDIPDDAMVIVKSEVATPKDWLERSTIANQLKDHLDRDTINSTILKIKDTQLIRRRRSLDKMLDHPVFQTVEMIAAASAHAEYLQHRGDFKQAEIFLKAASAMEAQLGAPAPGQGLPPEMGRIEGQRKAGSPAERPRVRPEQLPPEGRGFAPTELREMIGRGAIK